MLESAYSFLSDCLSSRGSEEEKMEDILYAPEPEELTEDDLYEVAGGWGCCGCGPSISVELELSVAVCL